MIFIWYVFKIGIFVETFPTYFTYTTASSSWKHELTWYDFWRELLVKNVSSHDLHSPWFNCSDYRSFELFCDFIVDSVTHLNCENFHTFITLKRFFSEWDMVRVRRCPNFTHRIAFPSWTNFLLGRNVFHKSHIVISEAVTKFQTNLDFSVEFHQVERLIFRMNSTCMKNYARNRFDCPWNFNLKQK